MGEMNQVRMRVCAALIEANQRAKFSDINIPNEAYKLCKKGSARIGVNEAKEAVAFLYERIKPYLQRGRFGTDCFRFPRYLLKQIAEGAFTLRDAVVLVIILGRLIKPRTWQPPPHIKKYARMHCGEIGFALGTNGSSISRSITRLERVGVVEKISIHQLRTNELGLCVTIRNLPGDSKPKRSERSQNAKSDISNEEQIHDILSNSKETLNAVRKSTCAHAEINISPAKTDIPNKPVPYKTNNLKTCNGTAESGSEYHWPLKVKVSVEDLYCVHRCIELFELVHVEIGLTHDRANLVFFYATAVRAREAKVDNENRKVSIFKANVRKHRRSFNNSSQQERARAELQRHFDSLKSLNRMENNIGKLVSELANAVHLDAKLKHAGGL